MDINHAPGPDDATRKSSHRGGGNLPSRLGKVPNYTYHNLSIGARPYGGYSYNSRGYYNFRVYVVGDANDKTCRKVRVVHISDTRGAHDNLAVNIPRGDILIHTGDFYSPQSAALQGLSWLERLQTIEKFFQKLPHQYKIFVPGCQDYLLRQDGKNRPSPHEIQDELKSVIYLEDCSCSIFGIKFYGTPWVSKDDIRPQDELNLKPSVSRIRRLSRKIRIRSCLGTDHASSTTAAKNKPASPCCDSQGFTLASIEGVAERMKSVPSDTHVLLTHGPAWRQIISRTIFDHVKPLLVLMGHDFASYGVIWRQGILFSNAALQLNPEVPFSHNNTAYQPRSILPMWERGGTISSITTQDSSVSDPEQLKSRQQQQQATNRGLSNRRRCTSECNPKWPTEFNQPYECDAKIRILPDTVELEEKHEEPHKQPQHQQTNSSSSWRSPVLVQSYVSHTSPPLPEEDQETRLSVERSGLPFTRNGLQPNDAGYRRPPRWQRRLPPALFQLINSSNQRPRLVDRVRHSFGQLFRTRPGTEPQQRITPQQQNPSTSTAPGRVRSLQKPVSLPFTPSTMAALECANLDYKEMGIIYDTNFGHSSGINGCPVVNDYQRASHKSSRQGSFCSQSSSSRKASVSVVPRVPIVFDIHVSSQAGPELVPPVYDLTQAPIPTPSVDPNGKKLVPSKTGEAETEENNGTLKDLNNNTGSAAPLKEIF